MASPPEGDLELLRSWWSDLKTELPDDVRGLWFGIVDLDVDGDARRTLYVAGSPEFDSEDADADWATDYSWWPEGRYVDLPGLADLPEGPYEDVLDYTIALVRDLNPLSIGAVEGAAVGFDDGDFKLI